MIGQYLLNKNENAKFEFFSELNQAYVIFPVFLNKKRERGMVAVLFQTNQSAAER